MEPVLRRANTLHVAGYSSDDIRRLRRTGALVAVRRGAYVERSPDDPAVRHLLLLRAALAELAPAAVASHVSAAVLHGLPTWGLPLDRAHVTFDRRRGGRVDDRVHVHTAPLHPDDVVMVDGLAVTSRARTVVDLGRRFGFESAVVVADAALRQAGRDPTALRPALDETLARAKGWPGVPAARQVVAFADGRAESVGESRSRVAIARAGLPTPRLQWPVRLARTTVYADFAWPERRTLGEFDGRVKYGRLLRPGQDPGDAVFEEKTREDAVRAEDWEVARWIWTDLHDFTDTAVRIRGRFRS